MRIATFNANSIRKRLPIILDWLKNTPPDVLCLQETKVHDDEFPLSAFADSGYHVVFRGMKGYNGVALLSRERPQEVMYGFNDGDAAEEPRLLRATVSGITILNTYVPQGYLISSPKYEYKLRWYKRLRNYFERHFSPAQSIVWCGDMNVAPTPMDVHHPEKHENHVCYHVNARQAYQNTLSWGFEDVFRRLFPDRTQYTFWDYWPGSLAGNKGWRIDHILATAPMAARCTHVEVDIDPRKAPSPSDHTFLWAEFNLSS